VAFSVLKSNVVLVVLTSLVVGNVLSLTFPPSSDPAFE